MLLLLVGITNFCSFLFAPQPASSSMHGFTYLLCTPPSRSLTCNLTSTYTTAGHLLAGGALALMLLLLVGIY